MVLTQKTWDLACAFGMHQHEGEIRPFAEFIAGLDLRNVLEIGSLKGGTSALFAGITTGRTVSVDLPDGQFGAAHHHMNLEAMMDRNIRLQWEYSLRFRGVLGDSHDPATYAKVTEIFKERSVDLLFIDGDHTEEGVTADFNMYKGLVREGGLIAFHDILDTPLHRAAGCRVDLLWQKLKVVFPHKEFSINGDWGGIGVIEVVW